MENHENSDDNHSIPVLDGELVPGHVKGGARVRGYALIRYLPPPEKEHVDFYHTCHEFVPEESAMLDAHGTPILFNHKGKLGLCGQTIVDHEAEDGSGARYGLIAVHGGGDLAGEAFSDYLSTSIQKGRYTKVSLQHAFWLDSSAPNGVRKKALEISICKKNGRRAGAEILSYEPALEKRSYIKSRKGVCGVSCASLSSSTSETKTRTTSTPSLATLPSMEVDSPQQQQQSSTPSPSSPPSQQQQQQQKQEEDQQVPDISKKTPIEMMEMTTKTMEEKKRALEEKNKLEQLVKEQAAKLEELEKFRQQRLQEEAEKKRLEQEALEKVKMEQKTKIKDMAKSLWTAFSEQLEQKGEDGQTRPLIDEKEQQDQMEIIDSFNDEQLAAFNKFVMCTSAATETTNKRLREQQEQAARMEEELKRQKVGHLQERFSSAYSSSASSKTQLPSSSSPSNSLNHPTTRFSNLPQTMGKTVIQEASSLNLFSMPKIVPRGASSSTTSTNTSVSAGKTEQPPPPRTQEEAIRAYNEWFAANAGKVDRKTAEQALQSMVGTSAASADGGGSYGMYGAPPVSMTIQHTSREAWDRILQAMDKRQDNGVLACKVIAQ